MENYEIYNDLINGNLDDITAKNLFSKLADNYEQRLEFNSYCSISETIKTNLNSFTPNDALKNRIYEKAGINRQVLENQSTDNSFAKKAFKSNKLLTNLSSGLLSGILVYLFMQFIAFPIYLKNFNNSETQIPINSIQNKSIPVTESKEISNNKLNTNYTKVKYIYIYKEKNNEIVTKTNAEQSVNSIPVLRNSISVKDEAFPIETKIKYNLKSLDEVDKNIFNNKDIYSLTNISNDLGLSYEFGSSVNWNIPQETLLPSEISKFNNLSFTIFYKLNDDMKIGANIKQETFFTEYSGTEDIGSIYNYRQNPNLTTYSLMLRTNLYNFEIFKPYFQASLGLNESGVVFRPQIGIELQPNDNLSFILGIDYSYFRFIHQNSWFNAGKASINYGISYKF